MCYVKNICITQVGAAQLRDVYQYWSKKNAHFQNVVATATNKFLAICNAVMKNED